MSATIQVTEIKTQIWDDQECLYTDVQTQQGLGIISEAFYQHPNLDIILTI